MSAHCNQLPERGLDITGVVRAATLQDGFLAVPVPGQAEAGVANRQDGALQGSVAPACATIGGDFNALDRAAPRPGNTGDFVETGAVKHHLAGRLSDHRFRVHLKGKLNGLAARHEVGVFRGFLACHERRIGYFDPSQPLDVHVAFKARHDQPQRIALLRTDRLAVLAVGEKAILHRLFNGNAARHCGGIIAFGEQPFCIARKAAFIEDCRQRHAGPVGRGCQSVRALHRLHSRFGPLGEAVAGTLQEHDSRDRGEAANVPHRELLRVLDQSVNVERVCGGVDHRRATMTALEMQARRGNRAAALFERRERPRGLGRRRLEAHAYFGFELRARPVAFVGQRVALHLAGIPRHLAHVGAKRSGADARR